MVMLRACLAAAGLFTASVFRLTAATPTVPEYKLGDVATADVITPVALQVVNPEATEALKKKVAQQVYLVVRHNVQTASEAEKALRDSLAAARQTFMTNLKREDFDAPGFARVIREVSRTAPKDLPFDKLAPAWARGQNDDAFVESLIQPLRQVMAQPIVNNKTETPLPANQPLRMMAVKSDDQPLAVRDIEASGQTVASSKVLSLWRARRLVETHFPAGQEGLGRFSASFVRTNATPDPAVTDIWRAQRLEGVTVNDSFDAAQVIVRKGQTIDRKALSALAAMREKSLIGTLQVKLEQEQSVAGEIKSQTTWIAAVLGGVGLVLGLILWRLRVRPSTSLAPVLVNPAMPGAGAGTVPPGAADDAWRSRALEAEGKAERAQQAIRSGVLGWMREKIFRTLTHQRAELLSAQQKAEAEMWELEQRLEQLHTPLQERIVAYEKRIEELEKELSQKGEENRELIGARITVARQQLMVEKERGRFGTN
ncbi:hypothetical protein [Horticoccus sp. 23ND18S-11]|uniref:hypothetical protein n=1 Tax=Horticoccus sp. 23ND18S-11 TaxID=3391832 RepID=UPI0039C9BC86